MSWKSTKEAERKKRPKINFGIVRIAVVRSMFLISFFNVCMVAWLFIEGRGWAWYYVFMPISFVAYAIFDRLVTYRQELSQNIINSEEFMGLINNVEDIKKRVFRKVDTNASIEWFRAMWNYHAGTAKYSGDQMLEWMRWEEYWTEQNRKNKR